MQYKILQRGFSKVKFHRHTRNKKKYTMHGEEEFEDTKGVIRIRISKNRQHNGKKKKYKRKFSNNLD
jgi:hypothetical protein